MEKIKVEIGEIKKVAVEYREDVDILEIVKEARNLYEAVKLFGVENIITKYLKSDFTNAEKDGLETSKRVRAIAAYIMMNELHMRDTATSISRLETHFGGISLETTIGYRLDSKNKVEIYKDSNMKMLEAYIGGKPLEVHYKEVPAQRLYDLVIMKDKNIELWPLWTNCEDLYKSILTVGLENTTIWFYDSRKNKVTLSGTDIPERMRAFSLFAVIHMYRLGTEDLSGGSFKVDNDHIAILRKKFGLDIAIETILGDTDIFTDERNAMKCISLAQIAGRYLKEPVAGKMLNGPIYMQVPYNCIQGRMTNLSKETIEQLWTALDALYKTSKIGGPSNTKVRYFDDKGNKIETTADKLPPRIKAFGIEGVIYMYRMNDSEESRSRLGKHLALEVPSRIILGDTNVVSCGKSMPCVSLLELVERLNNTK